MCGKSCSVFLCIHLFLLCSQANSQQAEFLPQFNYWECSVELLKREALREKLDVSPRQVAQIQRMRAQEDFGELLRVKLNKNVGSISTSVAWASLDEVVVAELRKILADEQLIGLKLLTIRNRFQFGFSPYYDQTVLQQCGFSPEDLARFALTRDLKRTEFFERREKLRVDCGRRVLQTLSPETKSRFAQYAGNKYFPEIPGLNDPQVLEVHRGTFKSLGLFERYFPTLRKRMSPKELKGAEAILLKYGDTSSQAFERQDEFKSMIDFLNALERRGGQEIEKLLSPALLAAFGQQHAAYEFENDFAAPFRKPDVVTFLQLTQAELAEIQSAADEERIKLDQAVAALNEEAFATLCSSLPEERRELIQAQFKDVWKFSSWDR